MRLLLPLLFLAGCSSPLRPPANVTHGLLPPGDAHALQAVHSMDMLSWIAALSILGGTAALILTRGAMGLRGVVIGFACVLVNIAVARFANWIFIPILIATGAISLAYAYRIVTQAISKRRGLTQ